jgi:acyl carrier protein
MEEKLFARIVALLTAHFDNMPAAEDIHLDDNLHEDLNLDSIDIVDFIMMCETNFNVKLDMTDAKNTHTLRDLIRSIIEVKPSLCDAQ